MAQLRREYTAFESRECEILNVGPDSAEKFREYWDEHNMPFVGLADPNTKVAKLYQQAVRLLKFGRMPMQLIVDPEGVVCYRYDSKSMKDIPAAADVLAELDRLQS